MSKYEGHTPLPCPFCGSDPRVFPQVDPERAGNAWGAVACVNPDCPTYLEHGGFGLRGSGVHVYDGIDVADERGSEAYKAAAIRRWNRRAADAPKLLEFNWGGQDIRWQLEPLGSGGTRLTLWHNIDRRFIAMGAAGWHICLDVLDRRLAGQPIGRIVGPDAMKVGAWQRLHAEYAKQFGVQAPGRAPDAPQE